MASVGSELSDAQLVEAVRRGDERAFGELFDRYREDLVRYARRMTPYGSDQAEDVIQDVFASALQSLRRTDQEIIFKPWIYRITKNACIDRHRRTSKVQSVSIEDEDFSPRDETQISDREADPERAADRRQQMDTLRKAFGELDQSHHEILVMREFEGRSYDSIGSRMGLTPSAVQSMLFRARRRLQDEYEEIASGQRCIEVTESIEHGARVGRGRKRSRLLTHIRDCQQCRLHALDLGLDDLVEESMRYRTLRDKVAALLPFPIAFWRGRGDIHNAAAQVGSSHAANPDAVNIGMQKFAAAAAGIALLIGGGYAARESGVIGAGSGNGSDKVESVAPVAAGGAAADGASGNANGGKAANDSPSKATSKSGDSKSGDGSRRADAQPGASAPTAAGGTGQTSGSNTPSPSSTKKSKGSVGGLLGAGNGGGSDPTQGAGQQLSETVDQTVGGVHDTLDQTGQGLKDSGLPAGKELGETVQGVNQNLKQTTGPVTDTVGGLLGGKKK